MALKSLVTIMKTFLEKKEWAIFWGKLGNVVFFAIRPRVENGRHESSSFFFFNERTEWGKLSFTTAINCPNERIFS